MKTYPLLQSQMGVFLEWRQAPDSTKYNIPVVATFGKEVDPDRLESALKSIVLVRKELRTRTIVDEDGVPRQWSDPTMSIPVLRKKMTEEEALLYIDNGFIRPYDLLSGEPLCRTEIIETPKHVYWLWDPQHIIIDGTTHEPNFFQNDIPLAYSGKDLQTYDYDIYQHAEKEVNDFSSDAYIAAKQYYLEKFKDCEPVSLSLNTSNPWGNCIRSSAFVDCNSINSRCSELGIASNLLFMASFSLVLSRFSGKDKVTYYTINHGRNDRRLKHAYGMFVKSVPILADIKEEQRVIDFIKGFRQELNSTIRYGIYPFTHFCRDLDLYPKISFGFQGESMQEITIVNGREYLLHQPVNGKTDKNITCIVYIVNGEYDIRIEASDSLYSAEYLQKIADAIKVVGEQMLTTPDKLLGEISTTSGDYQKDIIALSKGKTITYNSDETFVDVFVREAEQHPNDLAVVCDKENYTYKQLDGISNLIAKELLLEGVKPGGCVGIHLTRSKEFVAAVIGVIKTGSAYTPIDANYPDERKKYITEQSDAKVIIDCDWLKKIDLRKLEEVDAVNLAKPNLPAYIIYTSGTTGNPKGVAVSNGCIIACAAWLIPEFGLTSGKKNLLQPSLSFDASTFDLFYPLMAGGEIHLLNDQMCRDTEKIASYIESNGITGMTMSTAMGMELLNKFDVNVEYIMLGGEKFLPVKKSQSRLYNGYGPTEFTVCSSFHLIDQNNDYGYNIPIGRPVPNTYSFICDKSGHLLPIGIVGELCLAGNQIANGYWRQEELTKERFCDCHFIPHLKIYHTGDLAKYNENGELEYVGRIDNQIKLRGYRIEIEEIEKAIQQVDGIKRCIVFDKVIYSNYRGLVCLFESDSNIDQDIIENSISMILPSYMLPDIYIRIDSFLYTSNGKIDRKNLPDYTIPQFFSKRARFREEKILVDVISGILHIGAVNIGVNIKLKYLGVKSLEQGKIVNILYSKYHLNVKYTDCNINNTIEEIATKLSHDLLPSEQAKKYKLASNQLAIYHESQKYRDTIMYNIPLYLTIYDTDIDVVYSALLVAIANHPNLLSQISIEDNDVYLLQYDIKDIKIEKSVLLERPTEHFFQQCVRPFDVEKDALARFSVFQFEKETYVFIDIHHVLMDGYSEQILIKDILHACAGIPPQKELVPASDYSAEENLFLSSSRYLKTKKYYKALLHDCTNGVFPYDYYGTEKHEERVVLHCFNSEVITQFCNKYNITENTFFLTAVSQYLVRYTSSDKILLSTIYHGRTQGKYSNTIGMFVRTLPFVAEYSNDILDAIQNAANRYNDLIAYCMYPYAEICKENGIKPEILFSYDTETLTNVQNRDLGYDAHALKLEMPKVPLSISVSRKIAKEFEMLIEYDSAYYSSKSMESLAQNLDYYFQEIASSNTIPTKGLVSDNDVSNIIKFSYGGDLPKIDKTYIDLFCESVQQHGNKIAIQDKNGALSYKELDNASNCLAKMLIENGISSGDYVGIILGHRKDYIVAMIAILKTGAAYVPLDSSYPKERIEKCVNRCQISTIVTSSLLFDKVFNSAIEGVSKSFFVEDVNTNPCQPINNSKLNGIAYVIFTSGSTGEPKGVMIPNNALSSFVFSIIKLYGLTYSDKIICHSSYGFDASVEDIFPILTVGGELHCIKTEDRKDIDAVAKYVYKYGITGGSYSTQFGILLLEQYPNLPVRYLTVGGEKMLKAPVAECEIYNMYGPTEFTVDATCYKINKNREYRDIPIGRPLPGTFAIILDKDNNILPIGAIGFLHLSGEQIAVGYINDTEQTDKKFCFNHQLNAISYNTGDLVRWCEDGQLRYIGRNDQQIKIRGFRVELGEIETIVSSYPGIKGRVVVAKKDKEEYKLCCYYTAISIIEKNHLRNYLIERLADYMIPSVFCQIEPDEMKISPSGKIDRKHFSELPFPREKRIVPYAPPVSDTEKIICDVFGAFFGIEDVGVNDHYKYDLGGSSMASNHLSIRMKAQGIYVSPSDIIKYGTPKRISFLLDGKNVDETDEMLLFNGQEIQRILDSQKGLILRSHSIENKCIVLAGASGYLGIHLLHKLLNYNCIIICVIRNKEKLYSNFECYFEDDLNRFSTQLIILEKDISRLIASDIETNVDYLINCAANVKHYVGGIEKAEQKSTNTDALHNLIDICKQKHAKLIQVSTVSIAGDSIDTISRSLTEKDFNIGQTSDNDYVISKYNAEGIVLEAISSGVICGKIMRLGNLTSRTYDGKFQINEDSNAFTNYIKSIVDIGCVDSSLLNTELELSPIDNVADAIIRLLDTDDSSVVFHVYNSNSIPLSKIIDALNALPNVEINRMSAMDFQKIRKDLEKQENSDALKGIMHYENTRNSKTHNNVINRYTEEILSQLHFEWTALDFDYLNRLLSRLTYNTKRL